MAKKKGVNRKKYVNKTEDSAIDLFDQLIEFQEFQKMLPKLKKVLKTGGSSDEILKMMAPLAAARLANIAATDLDSSRALSAIKQLLDRVDGTPVQRTENTHKLEKLDDRQLDSLLESELQGLQQMQDTNDKDVH